MLVDKYFWIIIQRLHIFLRGKICLANNTRIPPVIFRIYFHHFYQAWSVGQCLSSSTGRVFRKFCRKACYKESQPVTKKIPNKYDYEFLTETSTDFYRCFPSFPGPFATKICHTKMPICLQDVPRHFLQHWCLAGAGAFAGAGGGGRRLLLSIQVFTFKITFAYACGTCKSVFLSFEKLQFTAMSALCNFAPCPTYACRFQSVSTAFSIKKPVEARMAWTAWMVCCSGELHLWGSFAPRMVCHFKTSRIFSTWINIMRSV